MKLIDGNAQAQSLLLLIVPLYTAHSFQPRSSLSLHLTRPCRGSRRRSLVFLHQAPTSSSDGARFDKTTNYHQFDYLLQESEDVQVPTVSRRRVAIGGEKERTTILASSTSTGAFPGAPTTTQDDMIDDDPYSIDSHMQKFERFQEQAQSNTLEARLKAMDFQDVVITLAIPSLLTFVSGRWVYNRIAGRVGKNVDESLDNFAREMILHDGNMEEMKLCIVDYKKKLVWMGPKRNDALLKRYLEQYAKKKTVSPQAIVTLSNVFPLFGYTEAKAADLLVSLCKEMGTNKISSAGKLLFFGNHILKTAEGRAALKPIRDLIMSTYRDVTTASSMIDSSQQAIAEAAYRSAVLAGGKNQSKLTAGWNLLGLDKQAATRIFEEQKQDGFISDRETMYGGQTRKYDRKGNLIEEDGTLTNPEEAILDDEGDKEEGPMTNVYECGQCGYTLFIAEGRESKFFGPNFKCPECGAPKSEFKARQDDTDD